ncbi:hypothetical protein GA0070604_2813 [Micromonospora eburnea]|uniref:Uncharacterized protein n=1 Tax=Micromonospora eburnea TaxID=227316 RepID=A0A1C6UHQ0_9ACTN|nr:hypothetical protein GA0070604_2813 [Micromonospora eburnea]
MIPCAAGGVHGTLDRLFEDVLAFEESFGAARRARESTVLPVSWRRWTSVIQRARR